jgi:hypothetical protein
MNQNAANRIDMILKACANCEEMKEALRKRAMVYQVDAKEQAALDNGLPITAYYNLPYSEWAVISAEIADDNKAQSEHCERVALWLGLDEYDLFRVPFAEWRDFWEAYKSEGLAVEIAPQELAQRDAEGFRRAFLQLS